jgi:hypothetical protein
MTELLKASGQLRPVQRRTAPAAKSNALEPTRGASIPIF